VTEQLTDLDRWAATPYPDADEEWGPAAGRHAYDEDAALTPIFHALTRGGWRGRQHEPAAGSYVAGHGADPVDEFEFEREPLTAPIPDQAPTVARSRREAGRHRRVR
jgi:hypothetical protein